MSPLAGVLLLCAAPVATGASFEELVARHFDYDRTAKLDLRESAVRQAEGYSLHEIDYSSPLGGRVPATLVIPAGKGPFPAILYGHWMMEGSPLRNRREFLSEAELLARTAPGVLSILTDAPLVRPGAVKDPDPLGAQDSAVTRQQVIDFRRAVDLLVQRGDVDPKRIAYVGHSFDAGVGAILAGVEKRISAFVLMAGTCDDEFYVLQSGAPGMAGFVQKAGEDKVREYFRKYGWADPVHYVGRSSPSAVFLQFATGDGPDSYARHCEAAFGAPKRMRIYQASHALNAAARRDRVLWLADRLHLAAPDGDALEKISQLK